MINAKKGLFWITCRYYFDDYNVLRWDFTESEIIADPLSPSRTDTLSHKQSWQKIGGEHRKKQWNYYPRGRIEIRNGKALVFAHPLVFQYCEIEQQIRETFCLDKSINIIFKSDHTAHYSCAIDDQKLL